MSCSCALTGAARAKAIAPASAQALQADRANQIERFFTIHWRRCPALPSRSFRAPDAADVRHHLPGYALPIRIGFPFNTTLCVTHDLWRRVPDTDGSSRTPIGSTQLRTSIRCTARLHAADLSVSGAVRNDTLFFDAT